MFKSGLNKCNFLFVVLSMVKVVNIALLFCLLVVGVFLGLNRFNKASDFIIEKREINVFSLAFFLPVGENVASVNVAILMVSMSAFKSCSS